MPLLDITPNPNYNKLFSTGQPYIDYYEVDGDHITPENLKSYLVDIKEIGYLKEIRAFPRTKYFYEKEESFSIPHDVFLVLGKIWHENPNEPTQLWHENPNEPTQLGYIKHKGIWFIFNMNTNRIMWSTRNLEPHSLKGGKITDPEIKPKKKFNRYTALLDKD